MSADRDHDRIVRSWLEEGVTTLPDRVLDAVLDELPATPQRPLTWGWRARRLFHMNKSVAYGVAAAAVVIVAILGISLLGPNEPNVGEPSASPDPSPTASALTLPTEGTLRAGTYAIDDYLPFRIRFDVPDGWQSCAVGPDEIGACAPLGSDANAAMGIAFLTVDNVVADPCDRLMPPLDPPVGPSVEDLATAISTLQGFTATEVTDVTVDGFAGKQFELTAPEDANGCPDDGDDGFGTWATPSRTNGVGAGEVNLVRILDVDGVRLVVTAAYHPGPASADEVAEIHRVSESVHIGP